MATGPGCGAGRAPADPFCRPDRSAFWRRPSGLGRMASSPHAANMAGWPMAGGYMPPWFFHIWYWMLLRFLWKLWAGDADGDGVELDGDGTFACLSIEDAVEELEPLEGERGGSIWLGVSMIACGLESMLWMLKESDED
ncbi:hypothetical protein BpHYR1_041002 [Brachionus plicatilis]|uniref:Uncharacterized protein n=1 Tax=Brachionus plicatilis TaxID=10195 RepID=A0A3M7QWX0_BRAPC|nr:hypothetical protein BpHYR1_041002 [Brachionus plicatilis]